MSVPLLRRADFLIGLALIVLGGLATWLALQISVGPLQRTLPPNTVPLICTIGIICCGVLLAGRAAIFGSPAIAKLIDLQQLMLAVLIGIYFIVFPNVDFRLGIAVFTLIAMFLLGCRSWMQLVLVPILTAGAIWLLFGNLFRVYLPTWI